MSDMLRDAVSFGTTNYDLTLIAWSKLNVKPVVSLGVQGLQYCAVNARNILKNSHGWFFYGDSPSTPFSATFISSSGGWYSDPNNWSGMEFPSFCAEVTIPMSKSVVISLGETGVGNNLEVELGGGLEVILGGQLVIEP